MSKLIIRQMARVSPIDWAIRFSGDRASFMELVNELHSESDAYWDPDVFDGIGGWVIQEQVLLLDYRDRFENLHQKMRVTQAREDAQSA